jgi:ubiquinone/menaquinone biosynthesis C-methylase UbiE
MSAFKEFFSRHPGFYQENNVFYQADLARDTGFEYQYIDLRKTEGRFYTDEIVQELPVIPAAHPLAQEWRIRKQSADRLIDYLNRKNITTLLEVGSGNGWLVNYLNRSLGVPCCGVDVNEAELTQAAKVFGDRNDLVFAYADILSPILAGLRVDCIVLASCLQYFADAPGLLSTLLKRLTPGGEIHILDTPVYEKDSVAAARERSSAYFSKQGVAGMEGFYFHHTWQIFQSVEYAVLYDPGSWQNRLKRKVLNASPFPWIKVTI